MDSSYDPQVQKQHVPEKWSYHPLQMLTHGLPQQYIGESGRAW